MRDVSLVGVVLTTRPLIFSGRGCLLLDRTLHVFAVLKRGYSDGEAQDEEMPVL
jgi:hypothetical protein